MGDWGENLRVNQRDNDQIPFELGLIPDYLGGRHLLARLVSEENKSPVKCQKR